MPDKFQYVFLSLSIILSIFQLHACNNQPEVESSLTDKTTDCRSVIETGSYSTWYKPASGWVGDPIPFYDNDTFYVFYLHDWRSGFPFLHPWYMFYTTDFSSFKFFGETIPCGQVTDQDVALGTGSIIKDRETGEYCAFYTGHQWEWQSMGVPTQAVLLSTSSDLKTWKKKGEKNFYLSLKGVKGYVENDFRDPHVIYDDEDNLYKMIVTTHSDVGGATLALLTTNDLQNAESWKLQDPIFTDKTLWVMECPDVFKEGDYWYLIYSNVADRKVHYRYAHSLKGPWIKPAIDTFDGLAFYAAKTFSNGSDRYLAGWCPTRIGDGAEDQWGGSLVYHKLIFNSDGSINTKIVEGVDKKFEKAEEAIAIRKKGKVVVSDNEFILTDNAFVIFPRITKPMKIEMQITANESDNEFGVSFGNCDDQTEVYLLNFDLKNQKIIMTKNNFATNNSLFQTEVPLIIPKDMKFELKLVVEKSVCVLYVNDMTAFSNRINTLNRNPWGVYSRNGKNIKFSNISVYK